MPRNLRRYQQARDLHFVTFSCYRRQPLLRRAGSRDLFLSVLEKARRRFAFVVVGYVVMPEHVHLLVSEPEQGSLAAVLQVLKQESSRRLRQRRRKPDPRQGNLFSVALDVRFWQRRYYDFNVFTEKKRVEKLRYMHRNPVTRGLAETPEDWRWSSYLDYAERRSGPVALNRWPAIALAARA
jgi:putative transposase